MASLTTWKLFSWLLFFSSLFCLFPTKEIECYISPSVLSFLQLFTSSRRISKLSFLPIILAKFSAQQWSVSYTKCFPFWVIWADNPQSTGTYPPYARPPSSWKGLLPGPQFDFTIFVKASCSNDVSHWAKNAWNLVSDLHCAYSSSLFVNQIIETRSSDTVDITWKSIQILAGKVPIFEWKLYVSHKNLWVYWSATRIELRTLREHLKFKFCCHVTNPAYIFDKQDTTFSISIVPNIRRFFTTHRLKWPQVYIDLNQRKHHGDINREHCMPQSPCMKLETVLSFLKLKLGMNHHHRVLLEYHYSVWLETLFSV